jgi:hypothetical protein
MITDNLPLSALADAQPGPARELFHYCLALLMVEAGKARLVETPSRETGAIRVFPCRQPKG